MKDVAVTLDGRAGILGSSPALRRHAPRLELPLARPRRRRLRRHRPRAQRRRLRRPALRRMGGQRHGPRVRGERSPGVRPPDEFRAVQGGLRQGYEEVERSSAGSSGNGQTGAPRMRSIGSID
ncbi:MAG: hypothetical protein MZV64_12800 [Ignavibacteriales bacterium]|nr:hypothetical protein [Ignavibacteriales bacterium]